MPGSVWPVRREIHIGGMNEVSSHRARKLPKRDREQRQRAKNNPAFCNEALAVGVEYVRWGDPLPQQDPSGRTQQRHGASYPLTSQIRLDLFHFIPGDLRAQDQGDHPGRETELPAPGVPMPNDIFATVAGSANGEVVPTMLTVATTNAFGTAIDDFSGTSRS